MRWSLDWTEAQLKALKRWLIARGEMPRKGVPVGGGVHAEAPEVWDGFGDKRPGWEDIEAVVIRHPSKPDTFGVLVTEWLRDAVRRNAASLSSAQRTWLQTKVGESVSELPSEWTRDGSHDVVRVVVRSSDSSL